MISDLLRSKLVLGKSSASGFYSLKCPICNDYQERLGIKFDNHHIIFNCFNCQFKSVFDENSKFMDKKFKEMLKGLGISLDEVQRLLDKQLVLKKEPDIITLDNIQKVNLFTPEVTLPLSCVKLSNDNFPMINRYLKSRKLCYNDYPFYGSTERKYSNRLIIPFYRYSKIIYWQARSIFNEKPRYLNCSNSKEAVLFNIEQLYIKSEDPLFITEGVFDALHVNGVSIIGSVLNKAKIELLKQSKRDLIFVVDHDRNGFLLAEKVLDLNLGKLSFLPKGHDINSSIIQYGKLWTYYQLVQNIPKSLVQQRLMLNSFKTNL
jgi:hypothetical protein